MPRRGARTRVGVVTLQGVRVTPLRRIAVSGGDVLHALRATDPGYAGFGEAYFSTVRERAIKSWRRHERMTLNLVVPAGHVRFVLCDMDEIHFAVHELGPENPTRLTVPPGVWLAFEGLAAPSSIVLNIADLVHDPDELVRKELSEIPFDWSRSGVE